MRHPVRHLLAEAESAQKDGLEYMLVDLGPGRAGDSATVTAEKLRAVEELVRDVRRGLLR